MNIAAIICEYNPFTMGHLHHIQETKEKTKADAIICIMSGNFVQRGEPAIFDKQTRTKMALMGGADVVFELPAVFALQSAELFARESVGIIDNLNCVDFLSFGSETNIELLEKAAEFLALESNEFKSVLSENMDQGVSFARARALAVSKCCGFSDEEAELLRRPNAILAIEYIKKLIELDSKVKPIAINRNGADYNYAGLLDGNMSAGGVRKLILSCDNIAGRVPEECEKIINSSNKPVCADDFFKIIQYCILRSNKDEIKKISGVTEGLENLIKEASVKCSSFSEITDFILSKRYTKTKINRILFNLLLGITNEEVRSFSNTDCHYARVLGFRRDSSKVIKYISDHTKIPLITNVPDYRTKICDVRMFEYDVLASDIYASVSENIDSRGNMDFINKPVIL